VFANQTDADLVFVNATDLITLSTFPSNAAVSYVTLNDQPPMAVTPVTVGVGLNWAISWIDPVSNYHKKLFQIGTNGGSSAKLRMKCPTDLSR